MNGSNLGPADDEPPEPASAEAARKIMLAVRAEKERKENEEARLPIVEPPPTA